MNWITISENDYNTYPNEGIEVLVSNGVNYDVAYYLMSSTYVWMKVNVSADKANKFTSFTPIKWCYIT